MKNNLLRLLFSIIFLLSQVCFAASQTPPQFSKAIEIIKELKPDNIELSPILIVEGQIIIEGHTANTRLISDYLHSIEQGKIGLVQLKEIMPEQRNGLHVKRFLISVDPIDPEKIATSKNASATSIMTATPSNDCSIDGKPIKTTPYTKTFKCSAATITVEGEKYPDDLDCSDVPVSKEGVFYTNSKGTHLPMTSVNTLLANDEDFSQRVWMADDVKCASSNTIIISYFGGGNCVGCERSVKYTFGGDGELKDARLPKPPKSNRTWMLGEKCLGFELSLSDKFSDAGYKAKYVVNTGDGLTFVAEKIVSDGNPNPSDASHVLFPDDFVVEKTPQLKAWLNCSDGKYSWYIYGNGELIDKGKYSFIREGVKEKY